MADLIRFEYQFCMPDDQVEIFPVQLDGQTLLVQTLDSDVNLPAWTELGYAQCPNCPLDEAQYPRCPVAKHLVGLVEQAKRLFSYDKIEVTVVTPERTISARTSAQRGVSSLMGLLIATSGCPHTAMFRPMARYHLPFANEEETIYRVTSMYLLGQYLQKLQGVDVAFDLDGLREKYRNIATINIALTERFRAAGGEDAAVNAMVLLDLFAKGLPYSIEDSLEEIHYLFGMDMQGTTGLPDD